MKNINGMILYSELIKKLDKSVIGRSLSFPEGWIRIEDLEKIINQYKGETAK